MYMHAADYGRNACLQGTRSAVEPLEVAASKTQAQQFPNVHYGR